MKFLFCIISILTSITLGTAQAVENPKAEDLKPGETYAFKKAIEIKDAVMLIRIDKKQRRLGHLRRANGRDLANRIMLETQIQNDTIMAGAKEHLDFCEYYFFDMINTKSVLDSQQYNLIYDFDGNAVDVDLTDRKIFVLTGPDKPENIKTSLEGILLHEFTNENGRQKLEVIKDPFPSFVKAKPNKDLFKNNRNWIRAFYVFNENLEALYAEAIYYFPQVK